VQVVAQDIGALADDQVVVGPGGVGDGVVRLDDLLCSAGRIADGIARRRRKNTADVS
jgi:hypothetical protein